MKLRLAAMAALAGALLVGCGAPVTSPSPFGTPAGSTTPTPPAKSSPSPSPSPSLGQLYSRSMLVGWSAGRVVVETSWTRLHLNEPTPPATLEEFDPSIGGWAPLAVPVGFAVSAASVSDGRSVAVVEDGGKRILVIRPDGSSHLLLRPADLPGPGSWDLQLTPLPTGGYLVSDWDALDVIDGDGREVKHSALPKGYIAFAGTSDVDEFLLARQAERDREGGTVSSHSLTLFDRDTKILRPVVGDVASEVDAASTGLAFFRVGRTWYRLAVTGVAHSYATPQIAAFFQDLSRRGTLVALTCRGDGVPLPVPSGGCETVVGPPDAPVPVPAMSSQGALGWAWSGTDALAMLVDDGGGADRLAQSPRLVIWRAGSPPQSAALPVATAGP